MVAMANSNADQGEEFLGVLEGIASNIEAGGGWPIALRAGMQVLLQVRGVRLEFCMFCPLSGLREGPCI